MGTPAYAEPVLASLLDADYEVAGVYTRPDTRAGRGKQLAPSSVKAFALDRGLAVFQPSSLRRDENTYGELASISPDLIVVAAYGLFLPTKYPQPAQAGLPERPSVVAPQVPRSVARRLGSCQLATTSSGLPSSRLTKVWTPGLSRPSEIPRLKKTRRPES